jgi:hypothetical protein
MVVGIALVIGGLLVGGLLVLTLGTYYVLKRNPIRISLVRPVGERTWTIGQAQLEAALHDAGWPTQPHPLGFSLHGSGLGRVLYVQNESGWIVASNDPARHVALLRTLVTRFGPMAISIPLERGLVELWVYELEHERMTIVADNRLAADTFERLLDAAHDDLVVEIHACVKLRLQILELVAAKLADPPPPVG